MTENLRFDNQSDQPENYANIGRFGVFVTEIGVDLFFDGAENQVDVSLTAAEAMKLAALIASYQDILTSKLAKEMDERVASQNVVTIRKPSQGPDPIPRNPNYNFPEAN